MIDLAVVALLVLGGGPLVAGGFLAVIDLAVVALLVLGGGPLVAGGFLAVIDLAVVALLVLGGGPLVAGRSTGAGPPVGQVSLTLLDRYNQGV